ncbi:hypothetical protein SESBI_43780 [Sesbania bispinosa]|nr:hypothetical protein SESBI_43780 [Sesbania bispinosa]
MGSCTSTPYASKGGNQSWKSMVNIIHLDGKLQQLKGPIKAWQILSQNPNCFLCSSDSMYVGSPMLPLLPTQELQLDHIYFLVPISKSRVPLSLQDLCSLAIKANAVLAPSKASYSSLLKPSSVSQGNFQTHPILSNVSMGYSH